MKLLSESNPKTLKGESEGYMTFIMHLAPGSLSGFNVCPGASAGCLFVCLNTAGRGHMKMIQDARIRRTRLYFEDRPTFMAKLVDEVGKGIRKAERKGLIPVFRLNGTSAFAGKPYRLVAIAIFSKCFPTFNFTTIPSSAIAGTFPLTIT